MLLSAALRLLLPHAHIHTYITTCVCMSVVYVEKSCIWALCISICICDNKLLSLLLFIAAVWPTAVCWPYLLLLLLLLWRFGDRINVLLLVLVYYFFYYRWMSRYRNGFMLVTLTRQHCSPHHCYWTWTTTYVHHIFHTICTWYNILMPRFNRFGVALIKSMNFRYLEIRVFHKNWLVHHKFKLGIWFKIYYDRKNGFHNSEKHAKSLDNFCRIIYVLYVCIKVY